MKLKPIVVIPVCVHGLVGAWLTVFEETVIVRSIGYREESVDAPKNWSERANGKGEPLCEATYFLDGPERNAPVVKGKHFLVKEKMSSLYPFDG